jgi:uncharacterized RDD family membrane protein YckC
MKTLDIITSHNVSIEYEAASVLSRGIASFLDLLVMLVYYFIIAFIAMNLGFGFGDMDVMTIVLYILMLPIFFYSVLFEYLLKGQTVGKLAMGIRVVKLNGENANLSDYTMRWAFRIIDFWFSAGSIAAIFIATTEKGQRLGDILAQTAIVKNKPEQVYSIKDILNIMDRSKHEPTYLGVAKFTDEDMILIKNAISRVQKYPNEPHKQLVRDLATRAAQELKLPEVPEKKLSFLKTLLQDYIVLTR